MRDIRCVCQSCGRMFLWTHEERISAVSALESQKAMLDTQSFKIETSRMKKPVFCGECRTQKKNAPA